MEAAPPLEEAVPPQERGESGLLNTSPPKRVPPKRVPPKRVPPKRAPPKRAPPKRAAPQLPEDKLSNDKWDFLGMISTEEEGEPSGPPPPLDANLSLSEMDAPPLGERASGEVEEGVPVHSGLPLSATQEADDLEEEEISAPSEGQPAPTFASMSRETLGSFKHLGPLEMGMKPTHRHTPPPSPSPTPSPTPSPPPPSEEEEESGQVLLPPQGKSKKIQKINRWKKEMNYKLRNLEKTC